MSIPMQGSLYLETNRLAQVDAQTPQLSAAAAKSARALTREIISSTANSAASSAAAPTKVPRMNSNAAKKTHKWSMRDPSPAVDSHLFAVGAQLFTGLTADSKKLKSDAQAATAQQAYPTPTSSYQPSIGRLPDDILHYIIDFASDQQSLFIWQHVSYRTYSMATPILYSRLVTISSDRGYCSFLTQTPRKSQGRLRSKLTLIPLAIPAYTSKPAHRFFNAPVALYRNVKTLIIQRDAGTEILVGSHPGGEVLDWVARLNLHRLQISGVFEPVNGKQVTFSVADSDKPESFTKWRIPTLPHTLKIIRLYDHTSMFGRSISNCIVQFDLSESSLGFKDILHMITHHEHISRLVVYGAGLPQRRDSLHDALMKFRLPDLSLAVRQHSDYVQTIQGDEPTRQALIQRVFNILLDCPRLHHRRSKVFFKLHAELKPLAEDSY